MNKVTFRYRPELPIVLKAYNKTIYDYILRLKKNQLDVCLLFYLFMCFQRFLNVWNYRMLKMDVLRLYERDALPIGLCLIVLGIYILKIKWVQLNPKENQSLI